MIFASVSGITQGDDLIHALTSDRVIENAMNDGSEYAVEKIADDYYKYRDVFMSSGHIGREIQELVASGVELYKFISMMDEEINRVYVKKPLTFKMPGIRCLHCGSINTDSDMIQTRGLDEAKIEKTTCYECGHVGR
jgi:hypothetical protein